MPRMGRKAGKKHQVLTQLFEQCQLSGNYIIDNERIRRVAQDFGFGNHFDATKLDNITVLPTIMVENDMALVHLGGGKHQFVKGLETVYHRFEPIAETQDWLYTKSLLNEYDTSESNVLSVANNQRILHNFVFGQDKEFDAIDISERPKTYFPHRTQSNLRYHFGDLFYVDLARIQIEIDLTIEYKGTIAIFEAKNGKPTSFSIYQLYHPFLYYYNAKTNPAVSGKINEIVCVYVVRAKNQGVSELMLWAYTFSAPYDITSITLLKSRKYRLIQQ